MQELKISPRVTWIIFQARLRLSIDYREAESAGAEKNDKFFPSPLTRPRLTANIKVLTSSRRSSSVSWFPFSLPSSNKSRNARHFLSPPSLDISLFSFISCLVSFRSFITWNEEEIAILSGVPCRAENMRTVARRQWRILHCETTTIVPCARQRTLHIFHARSLLNRCSQVKWFVI